MVGSDAFSSSDGRHQTVASKCCHDTSASASTKLATRTNITLCEMSDQYLREDSGYEILCYIFINEDLFSGIDQTRSEPFRETKWITKARKSFRAGTDNLIYELYCISKLSCNRLRAITILT